MRTITLEEDWHDAWEGILAQRVLTTPVTVFAGLGSPARVLTESIARVKHALGNGCTVYQVGPDLPEDSPFFAQLELPRASYLQMEWGAFMETLACILYLDFRVTTHRGQRCCSGGEAARG